MCIDMYIIFGNTMTGNGLSLQHGLSLQRAERTLGLRYESPPIG